MPKQVTLSDGKVYNVPDETTPEQIQEFESRMQTKQVPPPIPAQPTPALQPSPTAETPAAYWSRSPIVQAGFNVAKGAAQDVGQFAKNVSDISDIPSRFGAALVNRFGQDLSQGYDAAKELGSRAVAATVGSAVTGMVPAIQSGVSWLKRNILPPDLPKVKTQSDYDALPRGATYINAMTGRTMRKP